jgi:excisionase family DNA binding protein
MDAQATQQPASTFRSPSGAADWLKAKTGYGSKAMVYRLMAHGKLSYTRLGGRRLIPESALVELLERNWVPAAAD